MPQHLTNHRLDIIQLITKRPRMVENQFHRRFSEFGCSEKRANNGNRKILSQSDHTSEGKREEENLGKDPGGMGIGAME